MHHRGGHRVPERQRHHPARERDALRDPGGTGLEHLHGRQVASLPDRRDEPGRPPPQLALRSGLRALVRVLGGRNQPVVPGPGLRQPSRRPAPLAGGGLPPDRRPHRQGVGVHRRRQGGGAGEAVLLVLRPRRLPRPPPRPQGVDREVQRPLRHGLRGHPDNNAGPPEGTGNRPRRHRAAPHQPHRHPRDPSRPRRTALPVAGLHPTVGLAQRRRETPVRPHGRGVRRFPSPRRPSHRPSARLPGGERPAEQHHDRGGLRQRGVR